MGRVRVVYRKFDGSLHWNYETHLLGEDEHGVWVGAPAGTVVHRGPLRTGPVEAPHVLLFPRDAWHTACFNAVPHRTEIYCDITTVPQWSAPDEVTAVDLDRDVRRRRPKGVRRLLGRDGPVQLLDRDEFAEHQVRYGYPPEVIANAEASAERVFRAVAERREPFRHAARPWLAQVL